MLRILALFCAGIVCAVFFPVNLSFVAIVLIAALLILAAFTFLPALYRKFSLRWVYGIAFSVTMFSLTQFYVFIYTAANHPTHFLKLKSTDNLYLLRINETCHQKTNSYRVNANVKAVINAGVFTTASGEVLLNIMTSNPDSIPRYGDYIIVNARPEEILPPQNPSQFNYKRYLSFHNIYSRFNLKPGNYSITNINEAYWIYKVSYLLRDRLIEKLKKFFITRNELAVASALLVGFEDYLDPEIIQAFSSTGALHVLSVSGMHVGLVYLFLSWMLFFLDKKRVTLIIKYIVLLLFIWFYALITGFSPSVLRSVVMVSLIIAAKLWKRDSHPLNAMLASAFLLLCINPFYITEVGFQLSYLAVFGIVYLHPILKQIYVAPNRIVHWIWELTSVSLTAQLMTFPLGLLYFHQFPLLFLISNLIIIPLSTGIIYLGIGALLAELFSAFLFFFEPIGNFLWMISYYFTYGLNVIVAYIDSLKGLTLNGLSITILETWIIYLLIACLLGFVIYRNRKLIFASLSLILILSALQVKEKYIQLHQKKIIVYSIPRKTAIDFISGDKHLFMANESLVNNANQIRFFVLHNWDDLGLKLPEIIPYEKLHDRKISSAYYQHHKNFIAFEDKTIFIADKYFAYSNLTQKHTIDFLIITKDYKGKIANILSWINAGEIIFDSSVPVYKMRRYEEELNGLGLNYYNVSEKGAFVSNI